MRKIVLLFLISLLLSFSAFALTTIELDKTTLNAGDTLKVTITPDPKGYLDKIYFYDKLNNLKSTYNLKCGSKAICYTTKSFSYKIPSTWSGQYYVTVYDYGIHDYLKKGFTVGSTGGAGTVTGGGYPHAWTYPKGWNLVSFPLGGNTAYIPPPQIFPNHSFLTGPLHRYNYKMGNYETYPYTNFTVNGTEGYWFDCYKNEGCLAQFSGTLNGAHIDIHLGWQIISVPSFTNVSFDNIKLRQMNGSIVSYREAADDFHWIQDIMFGYDNSRSSYFTAGIDQTVEKHYLEPWHGYWFYSNVDGRLLFP